MPKFDTPAPIAAVLDLTAGRVRVVAADRADTTVEVAPTDASKSRDVSATSPSTARTARSSSTRPRACAWSPTPATSRSAA